MFNLVTFGAGDQNQMTYIILIKRFANSFHMHAQTTRPRGAHYGMTGKIFKETFLMRLNEWESKMIESHPLKKSDKTYFHLILFSSKKISF